MYALKIQYLESRQAEEGFLEEINVIYDVKSPFICNILRGLFGLSGKFGWFVMDFCQGTHFSLYGYTSPLNPPTLLLKLQFCAGGSLADVIERHDRPVLLESAKTFWSWTRDICEGLEYLHGEHCFHLRAIDPR